MYNIARIRALSQPTEAHSGAPPLGGTPCAISWTSTRGKRTWRAELIESRGFTGWYWKGEGKKESCSRVEGGGAMTRRARVARSVSGAREDGPELWLEVLRAATVRGHLHSTG